MATRWSAASWVARVPWFGPIGRAAAIEWLKRCDDQEVRARLAGRLFGRVGPRVKVGGSLWCSRGKNVAVDIAVYLAPGCMFWDDGPVRIGSWAVVGPRVKVRAEEDRPVYVGERVWLGEAAEILPGARVGDDAVVCAGTVVTGEVPPRTVVAGNPWRVVRQVR